MKIPDNIKFLKDKTYITYVIYKIKNNIKKLINTSESKIVEKRVDISKIVDDIEITFSFRVTSDSIKGLRFDNIKNKPIYTHIENFFKNKIFKNIKNNIKENIKINVKHYRAFKTQKGYECSGTLFLDSPYIFKINFSIKNVTDEKNKEETVLTLMGNYYIIIKDNYLFNKFSAYTDKDKDRIRKFKQEFFDKYIKSLDNINTRFEKNYTEEENKINNIYNKLKNEYLINNED